jgi:hypothetical protein
MQITGTKCDVCGLPSATSYCPKCLAERDAGTKKAGLLFTAIVGGIVAVGLAIWAVAAVCDLMGEAHAQLLPALGEAENPGPRTPSRSGRTC